MIDRERASVNSNVMFSSKTDLWSTPDEFFRKWDSKYHFDLDVCAIAENAKCAKYFSPKDNGLIQNWGGHCCWMNPPYGREIGKWVRKAFEESRRGATVVCLLPARTDTAWWHDYCMRGEITFVRGRLKFGDGKNSAPFPSAVVVFKNRS